MRYHLFSNNGRLFKDVHTINYIQNITIETASHNDLTSSGYKLLIVFQVNPQFNMHYAYDSTKNNLDTYDSGAKETFLRL